jgi:hypothetical protein
MPTCPSGHDSGSSDFCDLCGIRMDSHPTIAMPEQRAAEPVTSGGWSPPWLASSPSRPGGARPYVPEPEPPSPAAPPYGLDRAPSEPCPRCGTGRTGQFCEVCGYDYLSGSGPATLTSWVAEVGADRAYFDSVVAQGGEDAASLRFPVYCPRRRFRLSGREVRIGRRSVSRGIEPEIDLTGPPTDPGVSRLHAVLVAADGGRIAVIDPGSENGTLLNGREIPPGLPVPLNPGDIIHLGAWTAIQIFDVTY